MVEGEGIINHSVVRAVYDSSMISIGDQLSKVEWNKLYRYQGCLSDSSLLSRCFRWRGYGPSEIWWGIRYVSLQNIKLQIIGVKLQDTSSQNIREQQPDNLFTLHLTLISIYGRRQRPLRRILHCVHFTCCTFK